MDSAAAAVCIANRAATFLMGETSLDSRLARFATLMDAAIVADRSAGQPADAGLADLARTAGNGTSPLLVHFRGADEEVKRTATAALARELNSALLVADVGRASRQGGDFAEWLHDLSREAVFQNAILYLEGLDSIADETARESVLHALPEDGRLTIVSGTREWRSGAARIDGVITVPFETPDWQERRRVWQTALRERGLSPRGQALDALAECFRFSRSQIAADTPRRFLPQRLNRSIPSSRPVMDVTGWICFGPTSEC